MASKNNKPTSSNFFWILLSMFILAIGAGTSFFLYFEKTYADRAYPQVFIDNIAFGGKSKQEIEIYWINKNTSLRNIQFELRYENTIATISAADMRLGYDATLSATQAILVGRSLHFISNFRERYGNQPINLPPAFRWNEDVLDRTIASLSATINIPVENALFQFTKGKVINFKPSQEGRVLNEEQLREVFPQLLVTAVKNNSERVTFSVPVDSIAPVITTKQTNSFGIKERVGIGYSEFPGSIPGRIHNVALAASRLHGVLIAPGETFSFNKTVGDISAVTGYQSAYIIKDGKTVMGDGGGVCQVSTTMFRAALNAGLPITKRREHSYRVHYYEDDGSKAGLDATVFNPTEDLKFKNDTPSYILIQTKTDTTNLTLTIEFYGAQDGRIAEILNHTVSGSIPPPAPLYQDDPTLPVGVIRQVDFAAWGAKASFLYRVTKGNKQVIDQVFTSNYRPWQAVFLRGTKQ
ncbi:MAG: VanW family protein [Candidatus Gottesmanbacteria bacterium]